MTRVITSKPAVFPATVGRVLLIGDATHTMPPTAVLGAMTALHDAATLLHQIVERSSSSLGLSEAAEVFRQDMKTYTSEALAATSPGAKAVFGMRPVDELPVAEPLASAANVD